MEAPKDRRWALRAAETPTYYGPLTPPAGPQEVNTNPLPPLQVA